MSYDGIEVDMLNFGNIDSIPRHQWCARVASRILIDGNVPLMLKRCWN